MGNKTTAVARPKRFLLRKKRSAHRNNNGTWLKKSGDIALRILGALDKIHITQVELANRLNVSRQQISKIIKGQENLTLETIAKIEGVLGITLITIPENRIHDTTEKRNAERSKRSMQQRHKFRMGHETRHKIKPIIYHSFEEKSRWERDFVPTITKRKRRALAVSLMSIFHTSGKEAKKRSRNPSGKR